MANDSRDGGSLGLFKGPKGWTIRPRMPNKERPRVVLSIPASSSRFKALEAVAAWRERDMATFVRVYMEGVAKAPATKSTPKDSLTVQQLGEAWTSGRLLAEHGKVEGLGRGSPEWVYLTGKRLAEHVYPKIGSMAVVDVTPEDIEAVMRGLPADLTAATRTQYRSHMQVLFRLARKVLRLRKDNPVEDAVRYTDDDEEKDFTWLLPTELTTMLRCEAIPVARRVAYAFAVYCGLRKGSLLSLRWCDLDMANRTLRVKKTKTGKQLFFAVDAGLLTLLSGWWTACGRPQGSVPIFSREALGWAGYRKCDAAAILRTDLRTAGVERARIFEHDEKTSPLRFHDLRATFVTWSKLAGKEDFWITSRTGHVTDEMMQRYTRAARELAELNVEPFPSLIGSIPDLDRMDRSMDPSDKAIVRNIKASNRMRMASPPGIESNGERRLASSAADFADGRSPDVDTDTRRKSAKVHVRSILADLDAAIAEVDAEAEERRRTFYVRFADPWGSAATMVGHG